MVNNNTPTKEPYYSKLWNKTWLATQYTKKKKTIREIADEVGCHWFTVKNALVKLKIKRRKYTMTDKARKARGIGGHNRRKNAKA